MTIGGACRAHRDIALVGELIRLSGGCGGERVKDPRVVEGM